MCGICGRLDYSLTRLFTEPELRQLASHMRHRGPDDDGAFVRPGVGLAMRRLSIIDLAGGHQPISNEDGSVHVILNGEIYNYRELRAELLASGHRFSTHSDTEVIAHLWEEFEGDAFSKLRGMFGIALWDERQKVLALARDRIGIKPLYVVERPDGLDFASEMKVLLSLRETGRDLNPSALQSYFALGYIPPPETAWSSIREIEPGHWLRWSPGHAPRVSRYWDLAFEPDEGPSEAEWLERLDAAVADAVRSHLVSDVPVAAFLSGGLDSGAVVSYMAESMDSPPRTYTVRYGGTGTSGTDETPLASAVAQRYGATHTVVDVTPDVVKVLDQIVCAFDQPMADNSAMPTYLLSQAVARDVKVALSGLGGDELFGGYERHAGLLYSNHLRHVPGALMPLLGGAVRAGLAVTGRSGLAADRADRYFRHAALPPAERYLGFVTRVPSADLDRLFRGTGLGPEPRQALVSRLTRHFGGAHLPLLNRGLAMDYGLYLPGDLLPLTDRLSMLHSLEVRVPLVDHQLVELAARIPPRFKVRGRGKKLIFRRLLRARLPAALFRAPKRGFVGPTASWLRNELRETMHDTLTGRALRDSGWIDTSVAQAMMQEHESGSSDRHAIALWALLVFARWHAAYGAPASTR